MVYKSWKKSHSSHFTQSVLLSVNPLILLLAMMLPAVIAFFIIAFTGSTLAEDDWSKDTKPAGPVTPICVYYNNCSDPEPEKNRFTIDELDIPTDGGQCKKDYIVESKFKANWFQAWKICAKKGLALATVSNEDEEQLLTDAISKAGPLTDVWIGATDLAKRGQFYWMVSGKPLIYTKWYPGHPKVHKGQFEPCVSAFKTHSGYLWLNFNCYFNRYFACEFCTPESNYNIDIRTDESFDA